MRKTRTPSDGADGPLKPASSKETLTRRIQSPLPPPLPHPALLPGIGVEKTGARFTTNWVVLIITALSTIAVIAWALISPSSLSNAGAAALTWVNHYFSWLFMALAMCIAVFMLIVGYGRTGGIVLGTDDEEPEFSRASWISMLFAAGLGIGLLFYGPLEPLTYFLNPPPGTGVEAGTAEAMLPALSQTFLHWGPIAWAFYSLVGGAIAYSTYRRGRPPLISALFEPVFPSSTGTRRAVGRVIDIFAIIVTLFGTAVSLGIGALQIGRGIEIVTGIGEVTNAILVAIIAVLTGGFIASAVSGVKKGIRRLSNLNMTLTGLFALFVFIAGPTVVILNLVPSSLVTFVQDIPLMLARNITQGGETEAFLSTWTVYYWAWWVSWAPFVGMFIAKISRGRSLREFVTVVLLVPTAIVLGWFIVYGGTAMWMSIEGADFAMDGSGEDVLFQVLQGLPLSLLTSTVAMVAIIIFFVTAADSASIVMASMSQGGRAEPSKAITVMWGLLLSFIAIALLLAGGRNALSGLQSLMVVSALPFSFIVIGIMYSWAQDLRIDPYMIRRKYAKQAIAQGVIRGIDEYGDDFVFEASEVPEDEGAGMGFDSSDPQLTDWYVDATTSSMPIIKNELTGEQPDASLAQLTGAEAPQQLLGSASASDSAPAEEAADAAVAGTESSDEVGEASDEGETPEAGEKN
ncbi:BCCT family transporter [Leucobacter chinensis]|uniref:BCCT family transporter n=1 Tax=Leucobacter chinensis TaxID=2851010 RepID=UPI001C249255|nr:BCCT family transporter [Leucobacter chinensis]